MNPALLDKLESLPAYEPFHPKTKTPRDDRAKPRTKKHWQMYRADMLSRADDVANNGEERTT